MICTNISVFAVITAKIDYCSIIFYLSKSDAINLLENSVLDDLRYI